LIATDTVRAQRGLLSRHLFKKNVPARTAPMAHVTTKMTITMMSKFAIAI
jgi:hypothetical protein